jgi:hypothetical protein
LDIARAQLEYCCSADGDEDGTADQAVLTPRLPPRRKTSPKSLRTRRSPLRRRRKRRSPRT